MGQSQKFDLVTFIFAFPKYFFNIIINRRHFPKLTAVMLKGLCNMYLSVVCL